jgi:hypothetical protein
MVGAHCVRSERSLPGAHFGGREAVVARVHLGQHVVTRESRGPRHVELLRRHLLTMTGPMATRQGRASWLQ